MADGQMLERGWADTDAHRPVAPRLYLDTVSATSFAADYKQQTYELLGIRLGSRVLDVGCGTGDDVLAMAGIVGPSGRAVGVDCDAALVAEAWRRAAAGGLPAEFQRGDAHCLNFADGTFDGARADRAVQHMDDPARVITELRRVTRAGGWVVVGEPDWETLVVDSPRRQTTRRIVNHMADGLVRHGWIGRQLARLFHDAGLEEVSVRGGAMVLTDLTMADRIWGLRRHAGSAVDAGIISREEAGAWYAELEEAHRRGVFFSATVGFVVAGRVP